MKKKQNATHTAVPKTLRRGLLSVFLAVAGAKEADAQGTPISVGLGAANRHFASGMTVYSPDGRNLAVSTGGQSYRRGRSIGYNVSTASTPQPVVQQAPVRQVVRQVVVQDPQYAQQPRYAETAQPGGRSTSDGQDSILRELMRSVSQDQAAQQQRLAPKRGSSR